MRSSLGGRIRTPDSRFTKAAHTVLGRPQASLHRHRSNILGAIPDRFPTDIAVIEVSDEGLVLKEVAPGWTAEDVQALTEPQLLIAPGLKEMELM